MSGWFWSAGPMFPEKKKQQQKNGSRKRLRTSKDCRGRGQFIKKLN